MTLWQRFLNRFSLPAEPAPRPAAVPPPPISPAAAPEPLSAAAPAKAVSKEIATGYPKTYQSAAGGEAVPRPQVFEPALKHYPYALRLGDPALPDPAVGARWRQARAEVISHLLEMVSASRWQENLTLRGSLLLKAWLGSAGREPGDIDWVFRPAQAVADGPESAELFEELRRMASKFPATQNAAIDADKISVDAIWTYERAAGRRIVFPWTAEGLPPGQVQMDVVFSEELFAAPILMQIPLPDGATIPVWAATKEMSLAWKLLWLETDSYPQGKDLYDAALLAEQTTLSLPLLYRVLAESDCRPRLPLQPDFPMQWDVDWENFQTEYPWIEGEAGDWQKRLTTALAPMFAAGEAGTD